MKKIDTSAVSSSNRLPYFGRSVTHLKEGVLETLDAIVKALVTNTASPTVLYGCVNSATLPNVNLSAGAIYFKGEIYLVDAYVDAGSPANVTATITTTYQAGDPVTGTNGNPVNMHQIVKVVWSSAATVDFDLSDLVYRDRPIYGNVLNNSQTTLSSQTLASTTYTAVTGLTFTTPNDGITRNYAIFYRSNIKVASTGIMGGSCRIYNSTLATELENAQSEFTPASGVDTVCLGITCQYYGAIAPNNTIIVQIKGAAATSQNWDDNNLIFLEQKA